MAGQRLNGRLMTEKESCINWGGVGWKIYNMVLNSLAGIDLFHYQVVYWAVYVDCTEILEMLISAEERVGLDNLKPQSQFQQVPPLITRTVFSKTLMGGLGWWFGLLRSPCGKDHYFDKWCALLLIIVGPGMSSRSPKLPENHEWTIRWHIWSAQHWIRFPLLE